MSIVWTHMDHRKTIPKTFFLDTDGIVNKSVNPKGWGIFTGRLRCSRNAARNLGVPRVIDDAAETNTETTKPPYDDMRRA